MAKKEKRPQHLKPSIADVLFERAYIVLLIYFIVALLMLWESLFSGRMTAGSDFLARDFMDRAFLAQYGFRLWQPFTFGGVPLVDALHGDVLYPLTILLRQIFAPQVVPVLLYLCHLPIAGLFTYLFVRDQKVRTPIALLSGLFFMMTGCVVSLINAGHTGRLIVNCLLPGVLFFINRGYEYRKFYYFVMTAILFALAVLSPHVQMAYYLALASVFFAIFKTIITWRHHRFSAVLKLSLSFVLAAIMGIALAACLILPVLYYIQFSPRGGPGRGYAWATSWAMPPEEILNLVTPHFSGLLQNYWGRNYFKLHTEYLGILPLLLALFAFIKDFRNPLTEFFTCLAGFALLFAWGGHTPVYWLFYTVLPYVSKTRAPSQIFYLFSFSIAVLAGLGGEKILSSAPDRKRRIFYYTCAGFFGLWVMAGIFAPGFINLLSPMARDRGQVLSSNYPNFQTGLLLVSVLTLLYSVMAFLLEKKRLTLVAFALVAAIIFFVDTWRIEKGFIPVVLPPSKYFAADEAVRLLGEDRSVFRVLPIEYRGREGNYLMLHRIQSVGGEHGNQLARYQEFIGSEHTVMFEPRNLFYPNILNLLNVKYVIMPNFDLSQLPEFHPDPTIDALIKTVRYVSNPAYFKLYYQGSRTQILQNLFCLPRAFVVPQYAVIADRGQILETIKSQGFDPRRTVILEQDPNVAQTVDSIAAARVDITDYQPDRVTVEAALNKPGFLVLTDNYYPLWQATVDGKPVRLYRADYTFRAIRLDAGHHVVRFVFSSPYFNLGLVISLGALAVALVLLALGLRHKPPRPPVSNP